MGYTVADALEKSIQQQRALETIRARFPHATYEELPNGQWAWCAEELIYPEQVRLIVDGKGEVWLCPYAIIEGMPLYVDARRWAFAFVVLDRLKQRQKEAYRALLCAVLECSNP